MKKQVGIKNYTFKELEQAQTNLTMMKIDEARGLYIGTKEGQDALAAASQSYRDLAEVRETRKKLVVDGVKIGLAAATVALDVRTHVRDLQQCWWYKVSSYGNGGEKEAEQFGRNFDIEKHAKKFLAR